MSAIKKSVSMPNDIWSRAEQRSQDLGYSTMSAYLQQLVRDDLLRQGAHVRGLELRETGTSSPEGLAVAKAKVVAKEVKKYPPIAQKKTGHEPQ